MSDKVLPVIYISPETIMYLMDGGKNLVLTRAGGGKLNAAVSAKYPDKPDTYNVMNQDGVTIYCAKDLNIPAGKQIVTDLKKGLFLSTIHASVQERPKGGGFMGIRCGS